MILTVPQAFQRFYDAVNLPGEHRAAANVRKDWIVARLGRSMSVLGAHAIGSIPRYTALAGHADLDVLVVLHHGLHIKDRSPAQVLGRCSRRLRQATSGPDHRQPLPRTGSSAPRRDRLRPPRP